MSENGKSAGVEPPECQHGEFIVSAEVLEIKVGEAVVAHELRAKACCGRCGCVFGVMGVPRALGFCFDRPVVSPDHTILRAPIGPTSVFVEVVPATPPPPKIIVPVRN